ncbi:phosphate ABC transporter substrate-binding protein [Billgrantia azerbaijanica]|nr:phosphate ABC transporter substrate-binding protein [Halomonas azerbaijanica]
MIDSACADVVVVVPQHSPVERLSREQVMDIYLGRLTRLSDGTPVVPIDQREGSTTYREFYQQYLGQSPAQIKAHWSKLIFTGHGQPPRSVADDSAVADAVSQTRHAIGYLDPDFVDARLRVVAVE